MHSAGALALAPLGGSLLQSTARPAPRFHCAVQFVKCIIYNISLSNHVNVKQTVGVNSEIQNNHYSL